MLLSNTGAVTQQVVFIYIVSGFLTSLLKKVSKKLRKRGGRKGTSSCIADEKQNVTRTQKINTSIGDRLDTKLCITTGSTTLSSNSITSFVIIRQKSSHSCRISMGRLYQTEKSFLFSEFSEIDGYFEKSLFGCSTTTSLPNLLCCTRSNGSLSDPINIDLTKSRSDSRLFVATKYSHYIQQALTMCDIQNINISTECLEDKSLSPLSKIKSGTVHSSSGNVHVGQMLSHFSSTSSSTFHCNLQRTNEWCTKHFNNKSMSTNFPKSLSSPLIYEIENRFSKSDIPLKRSQSYPLLISHSLTSSSSLFQSVSVSSISSLSTSCDILSSPSISSSISTVVTPSTSTATNHNFQRTSEWCRKHFHTSVKLPIKSLSSPLLFEIKNRFSRNVLPLTRSQSYPVLRHSLTSGYSSPKLSPSLSVTSTSLSTNYDIFSSVMSTFSSDSDVSKLNFVDWSSNIVSQDTDTSKVEDSKNPIEPLAIEKNVQVEYRTDETPTSDEKETSAENHVSTLKGASTVNVSTIQAEKDITTVKGDNNVSSVKDTSANVPTVTKNVSKTVTTVVSKYSSIVVEDVSLVVYNVTLKTTGQIRNSLDPNILPHLVGLRNLGNTCYFNSVLQSLIHTPEINKIFLNVVVDNKKLNDKSSTIEVYSSFVREFYPNDDGKIATCISPKRLRRTLTPAIPLLRENNQQDAQEFLNAFLLHLHDEMICLEEALTKTSLDKESAKSCISNIFKGLTNSQTFCVRCQKTRSNHIDPFWNLFLLIPGNNRSSNDTKMACTVEDCLKYFYAEEKMCHLTCPNCGSHDITKRTYIHSFPEVLILTIAPFSAGINGCSKLQTHVDAKPLLVVPDSSGKGTVTYSLYAVVGHEGSLNSGHYTAYCQVKGQWYTLSDHNVFQDAVSWHRNQPYVLFYRREKQ